MNIFPYSLMNNIEVIVVHHSHHIYSSKFNIIIPSIQLSNELKFTLKK